MGTPIINLPQTGRQSIAGIHSKSNFMLAVLGLHAIKEKPVAIDGKIEIRPVSLISFSITKTDMTYEMMYLALTYDHRLLDGREAVVFLIKVRR